MVATAVLNKVCVSKFNAPLVHMENSAATVATSTDGPCRCRSVEASAYTRILPAPAATGSSRLN